MVTAINGLRRFHVKHPVEKHLTDALRAQAKEAGVPLAEEPAERLVALLQMLLAWNKKVNLTAVTDPEAALELHLVDSLAAVPEVRGARSVLDLGAGGGFPSLPLAVAIPGTQFTLVDAVGKKVGFLKAAIAQLQLANARAVHARAEGHPQKEQLPICEVAICRAFMPLPEWLALAPAYVESGGRVVAMLGPEAAIPGTLPPGLVLGGERRYQLPRSGAERRIAWFSRQ
jgi:16S rRNA (guanine527-N7)-methyltransferase